MGQFSVLPTTGLRPAGASAPGAQPRLLPGHPRGILLSSQDKVCKQRQHLMGPAVLGPSSEH